MSLHLAEGEKMKTRERKYRAEKQCVICGKMMIVKTSRSNKYNKIRKGEQTLMIRDNQIITPLLL